MNTLTVRGPLTHLFHEHRRGGRLLFSGLRPNLVTDVGRTFVNAQGYSTSPGGNGLNYIALSADALSETTTSTSLSTEISSNGFTRAQGTFVGVGSMSSTTTTDSGGSGFASTGGTSCNVTSSTLYTSGSTTYVYQVGTLLLVGGAELCLISAVSSNNVTVARGQYGTTATAWASGSSVAPVNTSIIYYTFTATGSQTVQKGALFNAPSSGTMGHVASLGGSRSLLAGDTLLVAWYVCVG